jgi:DNA-binding LacI/PurR family transcriptional regulator
VSVTLRDVAHLAGVSIKTASNVINDYPYIRVETRERVQNAIKTLGYTPNLTARGLKSGRSNVISLIIPDLRNAYFAELADEVLSAAEPRGLRVIIEQSRGDRAREIELLSGSRASNVDGILYSPLALLDPDADLLTTIQTPMILLGERLFEGPTDYVSTFNTEATKAATEHLLAQGRRRIIAFGVNYGEVIGPGLRLEGYRQAILGAGLPYENELVVPVHGWYRREGADTMRQVLASGLKFDGLLAFNDLIALGAVRVLQEAGLRIPGDVAVVGFDDIDETRYTLPSLSSIDPNRQQIAETAVRLLQERIVSGIRPKPRHHFVPFHLVVRESSAP